MRYKIILACQIFMGHIIFMTYKIFMTYMLFLTSSVIVYVTTSLMTVNTIRLCKATRMHTLTQTHALTHARMEAYTCIHARAHEGLHVYTRTLVSNVQTLSRQLQSFWLLTSTSSNGFTYSPQLQYQTPFTRPAVNDLRKPLVVNTFFSVSISMTKEQRSPPQSAPRCEQHSHTN